MFELPEPAPALAEELRQWRDEFAAVTGVDVQERETRSVLRIEAHAVDQLRPALVTLPDANRFSAVGDYVLCRTGPAVVVAISDTHGPSELAAASGVLKDPVVVSVTDISHGVVAVELRGAPMRGVLSGLVTADLRKKHFVPGSCLKTLLARHTALVRCLDNETFEIQTDRSLCLSLWQRLEVALRRLA